MPYMTIAIFLTKTNLPKQCICYNRLVIINVRNLGENI
ncbi:MAG: hypothetical protein K0R80_454 [Clostridia bacterium]|jgi:hypothetical protein|nr:hypothetical protein [Clostridia bacterium]